jgi:hypothetical protein
VKSGQLPIEEVVIQEQIAKAEAMLNQIKPTAGKDAQNTRENRHNHPKPQRREIPVEQGENKAAENASRQDRTVRRNLDEQ